MYLRKKSDGTIITPGTAGAQDKMVEKTPELW